VTRQNSDLLTNQKRGNFVQRSKDDSEEEPKVGSRRRLHKIQRRASKIACEESQEHQQTPILPLCKLLNLYYLWRWLHLLPEQMRYQAALRPDVQF
jgi:hypothetical protein